MKNILFLILLISNIGFAQVFNDYNFNTQYSDQLINIVEYETGYLLTGYVTDSARSATPDFYGAPVLLKLSKSGNPIDTLIPSSFGYTELAKTSVYRNGYFYVFGTTNPQNDSIEMVVSKYDTSFNFVEKRVYPQIRGYYFIDLMKTKNETDTTMYFTGVYYKHPNFHSYMFKYNFNTMEIEKTKYFSNDFLIYTYLVNDAENIYTVVGISGYSSYISTYDSLFNQLSVDTLFSTNMGNYTLQSIINIQRYRDSMYLVLGSEILDYPINSPTYFIRVMVLEVLDSNFQVQDYKYWYHDSLTEIALLSNALVPNSNNEYFIGGTVNTNIFFPNDGLLIVKIDSNLNTLWRKHIECTTATIRLMDMKPTDDGGVLVLYWEQATLGEAELLNSKLIKIGPNGEVTSIINLGKQISKQAVSIYPNPATAEINISLKQANERIARLSIIDIQGKVVLQKQVDDKQTKLDVSALAKGVYIVEGYTSLGVKFTSNFIKK